MQIAVAEWPQQLKANHKVMKWVKSDMSKLMELAATSFWSHFNSAKYKSKSETSIALELLC